jgi:RNA polymerase sigma factor (sigma-70 family)
VPKEDTLTNPLFPADGGEDTLGSMFRVAAYFEASDGAATRDDGPKPPMVALPAEEQDRFVRFFRTHHVKVFRAMLAVCGNREAADDATAEAFARAYRHWLEITVDRNPRAWVVRTAINAARDAWRADRRNVPLPEEFEQAAEPVGDQELRDVLIRHLNKRQREIVAMYEIVGMTTTEVAEALNLTHGQVRALRRRALAKLRDVLGPSEGDA